jgi:hypothetical protein
LHSAHSLRRQCAQRLAGIDVPRPFRLDAFAESIARHRGRPLTVAPMPGLDDEDAPSGTWVATDRHDFVFVDAAASPWHQDLIALHEIGHILWDHPAEADWLDALAGDLLPALGTAAVQRILGRHDYTSRQELQAELLASIVLERAATVPPPATGPGAERMISQLSAVIEHPFRHA